MKIKPEKVRVSAVCPRCQRSIAMRISNDPGYLFQCIDCCRQYQEEDIKDNDSYIHEIAIPAKEEFYDRHQTSLTEIMERYECCMSGYDKSTKSIKFGWLNNYPNRCVRKLLSDVEGIKK